MFAGKPVQRTIVVGTFFSTNSARLVLEEGITFEITSMFAATAGTNSGVIHCLNDFLGNKFPDSTVPVGDLILLLAGDSETTSGVFLRPERAK